jgi:hypothetical protein
MDYLVTLYQLNEYADLGYSGEYDFTLYRLYSGDSLKEIKETIINDLGQFFGTPDNDVEEVLSKINPDLSMGALSDAIYDVISPLMDNYELEINVCETLNFAFRFHESYMEDESAADVFEGFGDYAESVRDLIESRPYSEYLRELIGKYPRFGITWDFVDRIDKL